MRERWLTSRALLLHLTVAVVAPGCLLAGWWQLHQALHGNSLSWAYTVEWPAFSVIAVIAWWHLVHEDPAERDERSRRAEVEVAAVAVHTTAGESPAWWREAESGSASDRPNDEYAARVAAAARQEYDLHLARLADMERSKDRRRPKPMI